MHLSELRPIEVPMPAGGTQFVPAPQLLVNLPLLHQFLALVVADWLRESTPRQTEIDRGTKGGSPFPAAARAFADLQPIFLKCLFSYAFFYVATESLYRNIYEAILTSNSLPALRVKHARLPKRPHPLEKLVRVRNWSIAHLGSAKTSRADALAAMSWQPMVWGNASSYDLNNIAFGAFRVQLKSPEGVVIEESGDLELSGLPALHEEATTHLGSMDAVCAAFVEGIRLRL